LKKNLFFKLILITSKDDQLVEIEPDQLWKQIFGMIESLIAEADKLDLNILSIGLSCHRNSFVTLNRFCFFNFIFLLFILFKILSNGGAREFVVHQ